jgi:phage head maturation protease
MSNLSQAERDKLPASSFGDPEGRKFPIVDQDDVDSAAHLIGKASDPEKVKARIVAIARRKGLSIPDAWKEDGGKSLAGVGDTLVYIGGAVKALDGGKVGGYLVRFSTAADPDLAGDYFTAATDFGLDLSAKTRVMFHHGFDAKLGRRRIAVADLKADDVGVWAEAILEERDEYEKAIGEMVRKGKLGWSSGSAAHLVEREPDGKAMRITAWPIAEASLTPTPAEPRAVAVPLKSLFPTKDADAGLGYDDTGRDACAADAAISTLSQMLRNCVMGIFAGMPGPGPDGDDAPLDRAGKLARIEAEFADFTQDSLAVIAALMDDDDEAAKSLLRFTSATAPAPGAVLTDPRGVASAVGGYRDLVARFAAVREKDGRHLGAAKLADLRAFVDGASPALDDLRSILARHSAPPAAATAAKARLKLRLLALKHKHSPPASR